MVWRINDPQGDESAKVKWDIVPYTRGRGLDIGCGPWKPFEHFIGVDNKHHAAMFGWQFEPDVQIDDCSKLDLFAAESMDFVYSAHTLEHVVDFKATLQEWFRLLKVGGYLVLYLPHRDFYPNIGEEGANPDHKHDFAPKDISEAMLRVGSGWDLIENEERNGGREYSFLQVYRKRGDKRCIIHGDPWRNPKVKTACVVRYGGFGDMIQASSILPGLKAQGYHVTVMTTPKGKEIIAHDPHVDRFLLQDNHPDQVPNDKLGEYFAVWEKKFDRFINLCESVEGTLLARPGRANHGWPMAVRHATMNQNYLEFTHLIAEVPFRPQPMFYPSDEEMEWAVHELVPLGGFLIMWVLCGSSQHKAYPNTDAVVARIMAELPEARVIFTGDAACKILEAHWDEEKRVLRRSGEWSIRKSLTAARQCNLVVGPETGVLNAVSHCAGVGKVVLLSHSSHENLTRDWPNTDAIEPVNTACYPCHRIHYNRQFCPEQWIPVEISGLKHDPALLEQLEKEGNVKDGQFNTGAAVCSYSITPDMIFEKVAAQYERWRSDSAVSASG